MHDCNPESYKLGQRVHSANDARRIGTVKYVGEVQGYSGTWLGVDWDYGNGKHDGSINGVRYFQAKSQKSGSFVRVHNLSPGISLPEALRVRYRGESSKEEEASNKHVSIELVGKDKIQDKFSKFEELTSAALPYLGVSSPGANIGTIVTNLKELDLTGNLLSDWKVGVPAFICVIGNGSFAFVKSYGHSQGSVHRCRIYLSLQDIGAFGEQLPALAVLNLSNNLMSKEVTGLPQLKSIRILVLNCTGVNWMQVEILKHSLPALEELHLMGNSISEITPVSSPIMQGFDNLQLLNLEDNCIAEWSEILKLCQIRSLEQLYLNKNNLNRIYYPNNDTIHELVSAHESHEESYLPFQNLCCLLLGNNMIEDLASIDSLDSFPKLMDIRLSENPVSDPGRGGIPRFAIIARLGKIKILNGSEVSHRERKESEIRYVRLVMSKLHDNPEEIKRLHPRFGELKEFHGIEDERPSTGSAGDQKMSSGLICMDLRFHFCSFT
ncbi:Tubulin-folding cofactor E [Citrus sinensis]|uniref:Tubulin-folding cofactor E n=1 Tax=Citrus sinensis TaxID=2711 RepID=A0ACB8N9T5_CITSI|nr:Tubulin-folding cofactor E [Citrus sinensis]